jgi:hypothetical protein
VVAQARRKLALSTGTNWGALNCWTDGFAEAEAVAFTGGSGILAPATVGSISGGSRMVKRPLCRTRSASRAASLPSAKVKVCSRRPDDRRTGILCDHNTTKRRPIDRARERQIGLDEEWRAISVQGVINRDRTPGRKRNALSANRLCSRPNPMMRKNTTWRFCRRTSTLRFAQ